MKRLGILLLILVALSGAAFTGFIYGRRLAVKSDPVNVGLWRPFTSIPEPRVEPAVAIIGSDMYFFGGFFNRELQATKTAGVLNVDTGTWRSLADMPVKVTHMYALPLLERDEIWFAGGFDGDHPGVLTSRVLIYHIADDSWSEGPSLPEARAAGGFARLGNRLHYAGGFMTRLEAAGDHWVLDLDGDQTWSPLAELPAGRGQMPMLALGGELYVVGGQFGHDQTLRMDRSEVHVYNSQDDVWRSVAPLPRPVSHMEYSTILLDGKIVVLGGRSLYPRRLFERPILSSDTAATFVQSYDPATDQWTEEPALPIGMLGGAAVVAGDRVLVGAGSTYLTGSPQLTIYEGRPF